MRLRVGLTGGIGSGKSEVAKELARLGAFIIDADALSREATAAGSPGLARVAARWPSALHADGTLDRAALAALVFGDDGARAELNAIVHPLVRAAGAEREAAARPDQIVVHDVPLLFEGGFYRECDVNVLVIAPLPLRLERLQRRSDLSLDQARRRIAAQIDPQRARLLADYVIENDAGLDVLRATTARIYDALLALPARTHAHERG